MPLNPERTALSMQNLYLPRDAIYPQNDSKDRGRIERCCWSNVAAEIYYNCASFIGRYAWHVASKVINHDITSIATRKGINDLHGITIIAIFNLRIWRNFGYLPLFFSKYIYFSFIIYYTRHFFHCSSCGRVQKCFYNIMLKWQENSREIYLQCI